jgi:hypothetical protein
MAGIIELLKNTIQPFKLGKLDLLDRMQELEVRFSARGIEIDNWFDYTPDNMHGDCGELLVKAYARICQEFPHLSIETHWGYDDKWFNEFVGWHGFITVCEGSDKRILVDPGLQKVQLFDGSGYRTEETESRESVEEKLSKGKASLMLLEDNGTFLGIDKKSELIYYIGRNLRSDNDDVLMLTTYRPSPPDIRDTIPVDKRTWPISPVPEHIRQQAPYFNLAYELEKHVSSKR